MQFYRKRRVMYALNAMQVQFIHEHKHNSKKSVKKIVILL
jgi:hypothetical protein